jgi:hypothetical protein
VLSLCWVCKPSSLVHLKDCSVSRRILRTQCQRPPLGYPRKKIVPQAC